MGFRRVNANKLTGLKTPKSISLTNFEFWQINILYLCYSSKHFYVKYNYEFISDFIC